jgi:16S rRNA (cytidine1402-2'-O)-methyltransferase
VADLVTSSPPGVLVLAATPIGDPGDASARLVALLGTADLIAAEDTRRLRRLASALSVEVTAPVVSYHEHNEEARAERIVEVVRGGGTVLVVSDAGMPGVSDPGLRAARAVIDAGLRVTALPGPSAALTALALSGLPSDRFCFEGFLPRTSGKRASAIGALASEPRTMIFFESPRRTAETLLAMASGFGEDRPAAVCRELTKTYEEIRRGSLSSLAASVGEVLGEVTIVVGGAPARVVDVDDLVAEVQERVDGGEKASAAVSAVAREAGARKNELYDAFQRGRRR